MVSGRDTSSSTEESHPEGLCASGGPWSHCLICDRDYPGTTLEPVSWSSLIPTRSSTRELTGRSYVTPVALVYPPPFSVCPTPPFLPFPGVNLFNVTTSPGFCSRTSVSPTSLQVSPGKPHHLGYRTVDLPVPSPLLSFG